MNPILCMIVSLPAMICGYLYGYIRRGFIVGMEKAEEHIDA